MPIRYTKLYDDLQEFFGWTLDEINDLIERREEIMIGEWNKLNPRNHEDVCRFYATSIGELMCCVGGSGNMDGTEMLTDFFIFKVAVENIPYNVKKKKVLDYGCGTGRYGIIFHNLGYNLTFADVPGKMFNFLKYRTMKQGRWDVKFVNVTSKNPMPLMEMYDIIICYDVLEHVFEPIDVLNHLSEHLSEDGLMIIDVFFDDAGGTAPYHLRENVERGYGNPDIWGDIMKSANLVPVIYNEQGPPKVYRKVK